MWLITQTHETGSRWNAAFDVGRQAVEQTVSSDIREVCRAAELIRESRTAVKFHAVDTSVVEVHSHEHRTRRRGRYKNQSSRILGGDLFAAEERSGRAGREHQSLIEIDVF